MRSLTLLSSLGILALTASALAAPTTYSGRRLAINVGVLVVDSQTTGGVPTNFAPHIWSQLDKDRAVKPAAWSFQNPRSSTILTDFGRNRALSRGMGNVAASGSRLTKDDALYWEVDLDQAGDNQLNAYDALVLVASGTISLNPKEREKLRRFVDQGGLLWVDAIEGSPAFDVNNPLPIPIAFANNAGPLLLDPLHPLLSIPNNLTAPEVGGLFVGSGTIEVPTTAPSPETQGWALIDGLKIDPVVGTSAASMAMGLARLGDGYLLVTTRFVSGALNQGLQPNGQVNTVNRDYKSLPPAFTPAFRSAAKIVVNALSLRANTSTASVGTRKSNSIGIDISAPLLKRFEASQIVPADGTVPVMYKNRIVLVNRSNQLVVLDADPLTDLDGDGNPDDGVADPLGSQIDVLWVSQAFAGRLSTPSCTELIRNNENADAADVILLHQVEDSQPSRVLQFPFRNNGTNITPDITYESATATAQNGVNAAVIPQKAPASPTVHEGMVYVADITAANSGQGRVWVIDLMRRVRMESGTRPWEIRAAPRLQAIDGSPAVGYIPVQDSSGAVDKVVYVPMQPDGQRSAGFVSLWVGSRGEAPVSIQQTGGNLLITTRAALQNLPIYASGGSGQPSLDVKLSVINPVTGRPYSGGSMTGMFNGAPIVNASQNGTIRVDLGGFGNSLVWSGPNPTAAIRVDYTLDWGQAGLGPGAVAAENYIRGEVQLPDEAGNNRRILGNVALAGNGNLFVVTAPADLARSGGAIFCLKERGRGDFEMLYRWEAFDQLNILSSNSGGIRRIPYDGAVIDYDGLLQFPGIGGFLNRPLTNLSFATGPVVQGDRVYAGLTSGKALPFPGAANQRFTTAIMAFEADPRPLEMLVEGLGSNFALLQPDPGRSIKPAVGPFEPNVLSVLQPVQFKTETINGFTRVTLNTVASVSRGRFRDAIISNLPLIARRGGAPDVIIQPDSGIVDGVFVPGNADGRWNPQRWQVVLNGLEVQGNLFASGNTLYFGGGSFLPGFLNNGFAVAPQKTGLLYAMDLKIGVNDLREPSSAQPFMVAPIRPWERYISTLDPDVGGGVTPSPYLIWPSPFGVRSFDDFRIRVGQAVLGDINTSVPVRGLVAGNDSLVAWDQNRAYSFARSDLTVVDEGRILRVDPSGGPIWSAETTLKGGDAGDIGSTLREQRLARPSRAYSMGGGAYLIADPGNNRVVRVDSGGRETRTITEFSIDPIYLPPGVPDNLSKKLAGPRDVYSFTTFRSDAEINTLVAQSRLSPALQRQLGGTAEYWTHYYIADTGNQRVIELIDRFEFDSNRGVVGRVVRIDDPTSDAPVTNIAGVNRRLVPAIGQLRWQIRSELTRKQYSYNSIDRAWITDAAGSRPLLLFGFGNVEPVRSSFNLDDTPGRVDNQVGAGGVVLYDPNNGATNVLTEFEMPPIPNAVFWNDQTVSFGVPGVQNSYGAGGVRKVSGLRSASLSFAGGTLSVMITDSNGVFEVVPGGSGWVARWALPKEAYLVMRRGRSIPGNNASPIVPTAKNPMGFIPTYARRLNSGEVLVVNGYVGQHRVPSLPVVAAFGISPGDPFGGEVAILDGSINADPAVRGFDWNKPNLGFDSYYVNFELPPVAGTRNLQGPVFAEKR